MKQVCKPKKKAIMLTLSEKICHFRGFCTVSLLLADLGPDYLHSSF